MVGGNSPRSSASTHEAASIAPAAPNRCPCTDFVELTASSRAWSPKTALIAFVSATSPRLVHVLEHEHHRAFAHHESVATEVEWPACLLRLVVALARRLDLAERAHRQRRDRRLGAA